MLNDQELADIASYLENKDDSKLSHPHTPSLDVYSLGDNPFAYLDRSKPILSISLRADTTLANHLISKYEEVSTGYKLDPKKWITIILSGQLGVEDIKAFIDHSYQLSADTNGLG